MLLFEPYGYSHNVNTDNPRSSSLEEIDNFRDVLNQIVKKTW